MEKYLREFFKHGTRIGLFFQSSILRSQLWPESRITFNIISTKEWDDLRYRFGTSSSQWGGNRYRPFAFTEQGVAMLSGILNSQRAVETNIAIMRTFVALRKLMQSNNELAAKIKRLEKKYDQ